MSFPRPITAIVVTGILAGITGCVGPMDMTGNRTAMADNKSDSFSTVSQSTSVPVTFTDKRSLQYDTGAMDPDVPDAFQSTDSGLRYRILRKSTGRKPTAADTVTVHYRGWLDSGREFDSSYDSGQPATFPLNGVVAGWTEGMQLIGEGGMIELWVPGRLGYGTQGSGNIPPNATLHFVVELLKVR